jgi:V-type H+-transporting ATPase subunit a
MDELGRIDDAIEFIDLNKENLESKKHFNEIISRCDEIEKKLLKFDKLCLDYGIEIVQYTKYKKFLKDLNQDLSYRSKRRSTAYFDMVENELFEDERRIQELIDSYEKIKESLNTLIERKAVIEKSTELFNGGGLLREASGRDETARMLEEGFVSDLNYIAGVAKAEDEMRMKRMIFRISKGRAVPHFFNFPEDLRKSEKVVKINNLINCKTYF